MADTLKKFGKYFLLDLLAQGGMAEIYRARHATPMGGGRLLAIKRIQSSYSSNPEFINMFRGETKVTSSFTHPNIIQVYDYGEEQNQLYIAMEYVDGRNLRQFITRHADIKQLFPVEVSCFVIEQSCSALLYAHDFKDKFSGKSLNIIHRDISPQNILISYDGAVKVIDFGIAKTEAQAEATRAGVIKGKPSYLSPEQIMGDTLDGRSDVFALGIVFWEMLTGRKLFAGENDLAVIRMIENCQSHVKAPSLFNTRVPKELDAILFKALEKDRNKRFQNAGEMQRALHKFLYQFAPEFNPADLGQYARDLFKSEIVEDRKCLHKLNDKAEELILLGTDDPTAVGLPPVAVSNASKPEDTGVSLRKAPEVRPSTVEPSPAVIAINPSDIPEMDISLDEESISKPAIKPATRSIAAGGLHPKASTAANIKLETVESSTGSYSAGVVHNPQAGLPVTAGTGSHVRPRSAGAQRTKPDLRRVHQSTQSSPLSKIALLVLALGAGGYYYTNYYGQNSRTIAHVDSVNKNSRMPSAAAVDESAISEVEGKKAFTSNSILLRLKIMPAGGQPLIKINGNPVNTGTSYSFPVPLDQSVTLSIERTGYQVYSKSLVFESSRLAGNREWPMDVELVPSHYGYLSINTTPSAEAIIYIDGGEERMQTPFSGKRLPVGQYSIRLENKLLQMSKDVKATIEENRIRKIEERLSVITDAN